MREPISYELANELKEAGFPDSQFWSDAGEEYYDEEGHPMPTLSELVEACGDRFLYIIRDRDAVWRAWEKALRSTARPSRPVAPPPTRSRATEKSEAVARLWLALNRKEA